MTLHDACTSATSRILTVASLQRLAMEALIPAPVDCEVRSMIRFLNAKTIASCTRSMDTQASRSTHILQEFSRDVLNHDPPYSPDLVPSDFHLFLHLKKFLFVQRFQNDREAEISVTVVPIQAERLLRHRIQKLIPRYNCLNSGGEYVEK